MMREMRLEMTVIVDDEDVQPEPNDDGRFETFADAFVYMRTNLERDDFWWDANTRVTSLRLSDQAGNLWEIVHPLGEPPEERLTRVLPA